MEVSTIIGLIGLSFCIIYLIFINFNVSYKGRCILHDWEYKFSNGEYWKYNNRPYGRFLKENERYECSKCGKEKKFK